MSDSAQANVKVTPINVAAPSNGISGGVSPRPKAAPKPKTPPKSKVKLPKGVSSLSGKAPKPKVSKTPPLPKNPLAALTPAQIVAQANSTISKAYAPAYGDLNSQQSRASAINDKRTADDRYYQDWLDSKMSELQTHAEQANGALSSALNAAQTAQNTLFAHQAGNLVAGANATDGNVSNNANASEYGASLAANQAYAQSLTGAADTRAITDMTSGNNELAATRANDFAYLQANKAKQTADFQNVLATIASSRTKLNLSKAGDIAKEIARLQTQEISKAENTRAYNAAAQKLGLQAATLQERSSNDKANQSLKAASIAEKASNDKANQQIKLSAQQLQKMEADRTYQLNVDKYNAAQAKDIYERQHKLGPYKPGAAKSAAGTTAAELKAFSQIDSLVGELNRLKAQGIQGPQAYHYLQQGYTLGKMHLKPAGDVQLLNAAYNVSVYGHGLTQGDVNALRQRGYKPRGRYRFGGGVH